MFALTLHFYSPRAYRYIRDKFQKHLPHKRTIQKWYANSTVAINAGFSSHAFEILAAKASELRSDGIEPLCCLIFNEMAIMKCLQWSRAEKKFSGQITYGLRTSSEEVPIANNALVFMVNGINFKATVPVAHYFIQNLNGSEKATLLKEVITSIAKCGVKVLSITFDNLATNFAMCRELGANFNIRHLKPYIILPGDEHKIYVIVDPSHILKLVRNTIGNKKKLVNGENEEINWKYFESLEQLRIKEDFAHIHRLTKKHIEFQNAKMNVRLAAQTLSNSVANSMEMLMEKGYEPFSNSSATIEFTRFINNCFDIMNTKDKTNVNSANKFKSAIDSQNKTEIFTFLANITTYLKQIKFPCGQSVIRSKSRAAFRGIVINAANFKSIYDEYVESNLLDRLSTFAFSQDHLESLFGRIRSLNGYNDNPTAGQFSAALKKIIVCGEIKSSELSNCEDGLNLTILNISSRQKKTVTSDLHSSNDSGQIEQLNVIQGNHKPSECARISCVDDLEQIEQLDVIQGNYKPSECARISIAYIAASIEHKLETVARFECGDCLTIFSDNDKISETYATKMTKIPCQSSFDICYIANKYVKNLASNVNYTYENLKIDFMREFDRSSAYQKTNFEGHEKHKDDFIDFICQEYVQTEAAYVAKKITLNEQKLQIRKTYRKAIHLAGV